MEKLSLYDSVVDYFALRLHGSLWEESIDFFRAYDIQKSLNLTGFQILIFQAYFAENLAQKTKREESSRYPLLRFIPKEVGAKGVFEKTATLLHLNALGYLENYEEGSENKTADTGIPAEDIRSCAYLLSVIYLENKNKGEETLEKAITQSLQGIFNKI